MPFYSDKHGNVLAMKGTVVVAPWVVLESTKFQGRYYFFNTATKQNAWVLPPSLIGGAPAAVPERTDSHQVASFDKPTGGLKSDTKQSRSCELPLIEESSRRNDVIPESRLLESGLLPTIDRRASLEIRIRRELLSISSRPKQDSYEVQESTLADSSTRPPPIQVVRGLGQGGYGVVMEVEHRETKRRLAMKVVSKDKVRRRRDRERLALEIKIMDRVSPSPFIQQLYLAFETTTSIFMVTDLHQGGDLFFHLMERINNFGTALSETEVRVLLAELTLALEHVHKEGFIHRDVKVENVMLDARGHIKLIDFGLAVEFYDDVQPLSATGSLIYMAPEMIHERSGGRHTDWWAMGVLAHEVLIGESPWKSIDDKATLKEEIRSRPIGELPGLSPETGQFINMLLQKDYRVRLGTRSDSDVKDASFFRSIDWKRTALAENAPAFLPQADNVGHEESKSANQVYRELSRSEEECPVRRSSCSMKLPVFRSFPEFNERSGQL